jgi:ACT domain-containing protein
MVAVAAAPGRRLVRTLCDCVSRSKKIYARRSLAIPHGTRPPTGARRCGDARSRIPRDDYWALHSYSGPPRTRRGWVSVSDASSDQRSHTLRLELDDVPGELVAALSPIAENGGNLLSVFHERGNRTPRGRIPVEVDLSCSPAQFEDIVAALRDHGVSVVQADEERYRETTTVLLTGRFGETDLSDTLRCIESKAAASVEDLTLATDSGFGGPACARLRLGARDGDRETVLKTVREVAAARDLHVVEPMEVSS